MDKIFKEMSLYNHNYDGSFYAIGINGYNKNNERRIKYYKKPKSEKSKIWVKDVLDGTKFRDYAHAISYIEKTYDCELEYISEDNIDDSDYMIFHVAMENGIPVGFSYLNFKAKSSEKYKNYQHTVLSSNDPISPEYIHDYSNDDIADLHIPLGPALQLHVSEDEKNDLKTLINECYKEKAKGKEAAVVVDSIPVPDLVKDNSSNNKEIPHEYYVIVFHDNDGSKDCYFQGFNEYGCELYDSFEYAKKFDDSEEAVSMITIIEDPVPVVSCENNDPCKLFSVIKVKEYTDGDWIVIDSKSYKDADEE